MRSYLIVLVILGIAMLGMAWMPRVTEKIRISYSILYVLLGVVLYSVLDILPIPDPLEESEFAVRITELVVIISLMSTGLKIDERFSFKHWTVPLRLVSITMILSIALVSLLGWWILNLNIAAALLLGAVLAPTDPVLASDVQVGPPLEKSRSDVRFSLTAEAGLNDGMAFPFTWLAITVALMHTGKVGLSDWLWFDLFYRIAVGIASGYILGKILAYLIFSLPEKGKFAFTRDGFVAISATLLVYGLTELVSGYGFIAVFVTAITLRNYELGHEYHIQLHSFSDQIERMMTAIVLILFGGSIVHGVMSTLSWPVVLFSLLTVLVVRPLAAYPSVLSESLHQKQKLAISFFGIKGIGSFFYLSFALRQAHFEEEKILWGIVSFVVLSSIVIHGISSNIIMKDLEKRFGEGRKERPKSQHK